MISNIPKLKPTVLKYKTESTIFLRIQDNVAAIEDPEGFLFDFICMFDGECHYEFIVKTILNKYPSIKQGVLNDYFEDLKQLGYIENAVFNTTETIDAYSRVRWSRNVDFFGSICKYDENKYSLQKDLLDAKVCLLGCGGLGTHILYDLTAVGFINLTIVDFDKIELSNLNRQILYKESDINEYKVHKAKERVLEFCPKANINAINIKLDSDISIRNIITGHDLVICVADKPRDIVHWLNSACVSENIPFINGGLDVRRGAVYSVIPRKTGCVACWVSSVNKSDNRIANKILDIEKEEDYTMRQPGPAIVPLVSIITGFMVAEAIKIITKIQPPELTNKFKEFIFDDLSTNISETWIKQPNCEVCSR